jgi:hypothetical protein
MKFLIDECLSPQLALLARERGHGESSHVTWLGRGSYDDWNLMPFILEGDWTLVTKNSVDFRGPADTPGQGGEYADVEIHAGLVCLNGPVGMDLQMQRDLFTAVLDIIEQEGDLVNQVLEATLEAAGSEDIAIDRYALPANEREPPSDEIAE